MAMMNEIVKISERYESFKENLRDKQNFYLNYFYSLFGEKYESIINNVNFFHFASESIILEILKRKSNSDIENCITPKELNQQIREIKIEYTSYYENLRLITGTCYLLDSATKMSELKLAKIFLQKFSQIKDTIDLEEETVGFTNFASVLIHILQLSASSTLVELNLIPVNNGIISLDFFLSSFNELKIKKVNNIVLINYIKIFEKHLQINIMKDKSIMNIIKLFYFFSKTTFEDYLYDLSLFNDHSTTIFEKIKKVSVQNYEKLNMSIQNIFKSSKVYNNLKSFYDQISTNLSEKTELVKSKIYHFKIWINESISMSPNFFYEKYKISKIFLYDKILTPSKNLLVVYTDKYASFIMTNLNNAKNTMNELSEYFVNNTQLFMTNVENKINDSELCIKFTMDEKVNFIKVDLDNSVLMMNPKKFKEYVENFYDSMKSLSLELFEKSKNYLMNRYKLFLGDE